MLQLGYEVTVLTGASAFPAPDDEEFVSALSQECPGGWALLRAESMNEWLDTLASAGLFVSGRFHHTIAAAVLDTPFILLDSNTPKNRGLAEMLDVEVPIQLNDDTALLQMLERTKAIIESGEKGGKERNTFLGERLCALARENFAGLKQFA